MNPHSDTPTHRLPVSSPARPVRLGPLLTIATLLTIPTTGCQVLTYQAPTGERFTRSSLGAKTSITSLALEATTNGLRRVELRGYQHDSSQALGAVTDAAVKAAIQAAKP